MDVPNIIVGRKYRLRVIHDESAPDEVYVYGVGETEDGRLVWVLLEDPRQKMSSRDGIYRLLEGQLPPFLRTTWDGQEVTQDHAERITGLDYPACMDRLRELVHESE